VKAAVYRRYGPPEVVSVEEVPTPTPGPGDLLIRVRATTVSSGDWRARALALPHGFGFLGRLVFGVTAPRQPILGTELSGDVVAIGRDVTTFAVGDAVIAFPSVRMGAHAECIVMPANGRVVRKPDAISYQAAAALSFGGTTALDFLRRAELRHGESVLVNGASGTVGSALVQLAVNSGAQVTAVCSAANATLMRDLGAHDVIDYTTTDFASSGRRFDVIADTVGTAPYARSGRALADGGRLLLVLATLPEMLRAPWITQTTRHRVIAGPVRERVEDLRTISELAAAGRFTPLIDRCLPLAEIVAAHRHVESGRKRGSVVVEIRIGAPS
jgi:NADPH:quinone reductase-like Zn-dependent oxidoreductase